MEGFQERREVSALGVEGQLGVGACDGPLQLCDAVGGGAGGVADGGIFPVVAKLLGGELGHWQEQDWRREEQNERSGGPEPDERYEP